MKRHEKQLTLSVMATLITAIAFIYTLIMYHDILFVVAGMSLLFLIAAYILTQNLITFSVMKNNNANLQIKERLDELSSQMLSITTSQAKISKATFLYTKQIAQALTVLEHNYVESQDSLYKNLISISNTQNKAAKLMIKYDQNNTTKIVSTIKELRNQLSDTMIQGFDQIQPDNDDIISVLEDLVAHLKSQPVTSYNNKESFNLNEQSVSDEIASLFATTEPTPNNVVDSTEKEDISPDTNQEEEQSFTPTFTVVSKSTDETHAEDNDSPNPMTNGDLDENPNKQLSADEIAALFAAADPAPKKADKPAVEPVSDSPTSEDANKQLSADEIAALFAAAEPKTNRMGI